MNRADLLQVDGGPILDLENYVVEIFQVLDVSATSNEKFSGRDLERLASDILVTHLNRLNHITNRNVVGRQLVRIEIDLILLDESTYWRDFGNTFHRFERVPDIPVLHGPQLRQVMFTALVDQRVLVHPPYAGRIGSDDRIDTFGKCASDCVQIFDYAGSGQIN